MSSNAEITMDVDYQGNYEDANWDKVLYLKTIKSVPLANTLSTGTLVALLIIKINLLANVILIINNNNSYTYL
ncbi:hypothetical protein RIR_jg39604.t1 [Rhizophagus irregularis DAOM 181602=DAOM 197198]|nr:hypothetical protein RIR_jg39604.t1 [Rhizophagus irregularis DAOM 181602=DAOM 197198]